MGTDAAGREFKMPSVTHGPPVVFVVDDDVSVRESLELLIQCEGWQAETFASAFDSLRALAVLYQVVWCSTFRCRDLTVWSCRSASRTTAPTCELSSSQGMGMYR